MRERGIRDYSLVVVVEAVVITGLWLLGRVFG
jgi:hypothetical protein